MQRVRSVVQHLTAAATPAATSADAPAAPAAHTFASASARGQVADVQFGDGAAFRFHALWLRDACRDKEFVAQAAGERVLTATPLMTGVDADSFICRQVVVESGTLTVHWSDGRSGTFSAAMLRAYAPAVAEPLCSAPAAAGPARPTSFASESAAAVDTTWLAPYTGVPDAPAPAADQLRLWRARCGLNFREFSAAEVATAPGNLALLEALARDGAAKVVGVRDPGAAALHLFADGALGGLQKDPSRQEANWHIERRPRAASISYNPDVRLNNHTDQSLPNHGTPGLLLVMHYTRGSGHNTLVDGFAVAEALRVQDPEGFALLTRWGNDQERDLLRSRQDAKQNHTNSLYLSSKRPVIQLDMRGRVARIQYNEVFRVPSTIPFAEFPQWYRALLRFARMLHDAEFERSVPMRAGQILVVNNWRVLHGRAGSAQSPDRTLVGGTVTRETYFSRARELLQRTRGVELHGPLLLS